MMSNNSVLFPLVEFGLAKAGWTVALINCNLKGQMLLHALDVSQCVVIIVDEKCRQVVSDAYASLSRQSPLAHELVLKPVENPSPTVLQWWKPAGQQDFRIYREHVKERDPFVYIYTSGTTGPSKAARFSHKRWVGCGATWTLPSDVKPDTSYYIPLPLYHGNGGGIAMSTVVLNGLCAVVREKFSVSRFWSDIVTHQCRYMIHVGELWRYLSSLPDNIVPHDSPLKVVVGNGLRPVSWSKLYEYGVERVVEHYGSTEMPGDAVLQWFNKIGSCGYVSPANRHLHSGLVIKYDMDTSQLVRTSDGLCQQVDDGKTGELVMPLVDGVYDGYVDATQTAKKLYRSVVIKDDTWFSTGDLLRVDTDGFYYFVDRMGDTFRWKGENVATTEIESNVARMPLVQEANVYGVVVPNNEGKAGMLMVVPAAGVATADLIAQLSRTVLTELPTYAVPVFVRVSRGEVEKTSTFKYRKDAYLREGYDLHVVPEPLFIWRRETSEYVPLTLEIYETLKSGTIRL